MYEYRATLLKIVDGDTVDVDIDLGFGVWLSNQRIRLYGIDTPESRTRDLEEKKCGKLAAKYIEDHIEVLFPCRIMRLGRSSIFTTSSAWRTCTWSFRILCFESRGDISCSLPCNIKLISGSVFAALTMPSITMPTPLSPPIASIEITVFADDFCTNFELTTTPVCISGWST